MKLFRPLLLNTFSEHLRFNNATISRHKFIKGSKEGCCNEVFLPPICSKQLDDKVALVNGGSFGVGLQCSRELLKSGVKGLMISGNDEDRGREIIKELCKQYNKKQLAFIKSTETNEVFINHVFTETIRHFGGLDIVVNHVQHLKDLHWEEQIKFNITGLVRLTKESIKHMTVQNRGNGGIIINTLSLDNVDQYEKCPLFLGIKHFIISFGRALSASSYDTTCVKIITMCFDECSVSNGEIISSFKGLSNAGYDLRTVVCKAKNGSVWMG